MSMLPRVPGRDVVMTRAKIGYQFDRQRGSQMILRQSLDLFRRLVVPDQKEVAKGTLRAIIREVGLSVAEFQRLL